MNRVLVNLDKNLANFVRYRFKAKGNEITITRDDIIGRFICSQIVYSEFPIETKGTYILNIPSYSGFNNDFKFIHIPTENQLHINDYIESIMFLDYNQHLVACDRVGIMLKNAIISYMETRGIDMESYEAMKKSDYRLRKKIHHFISEYTYKTCNQSIKKFNTQMSFLGDI